MIKSILAGAMALSLTMVGTAFADKLDPKWAEARKQANSLGDAAKAGTEGAFQLLVNKAAVGDAPAMHNIGWLNKSGYPGMAADLKKSCIMFGKAAKRGYPPSMHEHALCLFASANKTKDAAAVKKLEQSAYETLFGAAKAGWIKSAIYFSEKIMNHPFFNPKEASLVNIAVVSALASNPNKSETVTLKYLKGMAVIHGPGGSSQHYQAGRDALQFADKNGHPHAGKALPQLYSKWVPSHIKSMSRWSPPKPTGLECYKKKEASAPSKSRAALECTIHDAIQKKKLRNLKSVSASLQLHVNPKDKADLKAAMSDLDKRSAPFQAGVTELSKIFIGELPK